MNRAGSIHGNVVYKSPLHQVDQVARDAGAHDMCSHEQEPSGSGFARFDQALAEHVDGGMLEGRQWRVERQNRGKIEIMLALRQRLDPKPGSVKDRK